MYVHCTYNVGLFNLKSRYDTENGFNTPAKGNFTPYLFWMELAAACMAAAAASCALRFMPPGGGHIPVPT